MSVYPCEVCGTTVQGPLDGFYISMVWHASRWFRKIRLCRPHAIGFLETHEEHWRRVHPMYGVTFLSECRRCNVFVEPFEASVHMYIDIYMRGQEKVAYVSQFCYQCAMILIDSLELNLEDRDHDSERIARIRRSRGDNAGSNRSQNGEGSGVVNGRGLRQDNPKAAADDCQPQDELTVGGHSIKEEKPT